MTSGCLDIFVVECVFYIVFNKSMCLSFFIVLCLMVK